MLSFSHSINLVTEINEETIPPTMLHSLTNLPPKIVNQIFVGAFINALEEHKFLEKLNENNVYAVLKLGVNE
jgi:hypothetical protein